MKDLRMCGPSRNSEKNPNGSSKSMLLLVVTANFVQSFSQIGPVDSA